MKAFFCSRSSSGKDDCSVTVDAQVENGKQLAGKEELDVVRTLRDHNTRGMKKIFRTMIVVALLAIFCGLIYYINYEIQYRKSYLSCISDYRTVATNDFISSFYVISRDIENKHIGGGKEYGFTIHGKFPRIIIQTLGFN